MWFLLWVAGAAASPVTTVELVTMGPGDDVLSRGGHAALCIVPANKNWPSGTCYHWGYTDFSSPTRVVSDYIFGTGVFWVARQNYGKMIKAYSEEWNRTIDTQMLPIAPEDADALSAALAIEIQPENREYVYHHLHDNCATRIRDHLDTALHGQLRAGSEVAYPPTWRTHAYELYAGQAPMLAVWELTGPSFDHVPTEWEAMGIPEVLHDVVAKKFGAKPLRVNIRSKPVPSGSPHAGQALLVAFAVAFGAIAGLSSLPRLAHPARITVGVLLGLLGGLVWFLGLFSALEEAKHNLLLALWWPSDVVFAFLKPRPLQVYAGVRLAVVLLVVFASMGGLLSQPAVAAGLMVALPIGILGGLATRNLRT